MEKIEINLRNQILKQPNDLYTIIVVCKSDSPLSGDLKAIPENENLYSGSIAGNEILLLEKSEGIVSIEADSEMVAL